MLAKRISIPSRRVGDSSDEIQSRRPLSFPSPQGGSETPSLFIEVDSQDMFPSPQGGSETGRNESSQRSKVQSFHPLKAGRRPAVRSVERTEIPISIPSRRVGDTRPCPTHPQLGEFPSPQGGSETLLLRVAIDVNGNFHPLKAGRRPNGCPHEKPLSPKFPSPQGGSETRLIADILGNLRDFHPLKAGRRRRGFPSHRLHHPYFHPLKAGRRLLIFVG